MPVNVTRRAWAVWGIGAGVYMLAVFNRSTLGVAGPDALTRFGIEAGALGVVFLILKGVEYADALHKGIGFETHSFFAFYWMLTLFHAAHVVAGIIILALVAIRARPDHVEAGAQFWHMVDLVWVVLFPIIYLLR